MKILNEVRETEIKDEIKDDWMLIWWIRDDTLTCWVILCEQTRGGVGGGGGFNGKTRIFLMSNIVSAGIFRLSASLLDNNKVSKMREKTTGLDVFLWVII